MKQIIYDEFIDGYRFKLYEDGLFKIIKGLDVQESILKDDKGKIWIPRKRRTFVSLAKQYARE